jgi:Mn2+/Fe2+ NRAMP family transporter
MDRKRSFLYAVAPLRFVGYAIAALALLYFGVTWAVTFSAQVSIWIAEGECFRDACEYVADNRLVLYAGYLVIASMLVLVAIHRYRAARRSGGNPLSSGRVSSGKTR